MISLLYHCYHSPRQGLSAGLLVAPPAVECGGRYSANFAYHKQEIFVFWRGDTRAHDLYCRHSKGIYGYLVPLLKRLWGKYSVQVMKNSSWHTSRDSAVHLWRRCDDQYHYNRGKPIISLRKIIEKLGFNASRTIWELMEGMCSSFEKRLFPDLWDYKIFSISSECKV